MMITVNRIENSITGSVNGEPFGIAFSEERYTAMKEMEKKANEAGTIEEIRQIVAEFLPLTEESYKEKVETASPHIVVDPVRQKFYLKFPNGTIDNQAMPQALVDRIIKSVEMKIDSLPLVRFWIRFRRNPNFSPLKATRIANYINKTYLNPELYSKLLEKGFADHVAKERATTFQTPITQHGLLVTYKVSREKLTKYVLKDGEKEEVDRYEKVIDEDTGLITYKEPEFVEERVYEPAIWHGGDNFFSGDKLGYIIRVGHAHRLESWAQVNCNDDQSCVKGLHCGNLDYIRGYQSEGTVTHNVFVDPMNIGAITDDGSGALRVLEYFVHSSFAGVNKGVYHSSTYADRGDQQYTKWLAELQTKNQEARNELIDSGEQDDAVAAALSKEI